MLSPSNRQSSLVALWLFVGLVGVLGILGPVGCSDENSDSPPTAPVVTADSARFVGFLLDGTQSGRLDITIEYIALAPPYPARRAPGGIAPTGYARALLHWPSGSVGMEGLYDTGNDTLYLSGAGYTLKGVYGRIRSASGGFSGLATTPLGPGAFLTGSLHNRAWTSWCGTYHAQALPDSGSFCIIRADSLVAGYSLASGASLPVYFEGSVYVLGGNPEPMYVEWSAPAAYHAYGQGGVGSFGTATGYYDLETYVPEYGPGVVDAPWVTTRR